MAKKQKKADIMDLVILAGPEAVKAVDELGWSFLSAHGYDVAGWDSEDEKIKKAAWERVEKEMEARGEELADLHGAADDAEPRLVVWFSLWRGKEQVAQSQVLQLRYKPREGEDT